MMDRELGFDLYTLKLLLLFGLTVSVCSCTVLAALGFHDILRQEYLTDVPEWQGFVSWLSFIYMGLYAGLRLVGRTGLSAIANTADRAANGEPNIFAELVANDFENFGKFELPN